jgi:tetratricopeptide (TPR) repeat protein
MLSKERMNDVNKLLATVSQLEAQGKIKQAIKDLQKAVKADMADGNVYNRLGDLHVKANETSDAIEAFKKGVEIFKNDTFYRNALALCKKILRYDPGNVEIYADIAGILLELDEKSDAMIYYFSYIDKQLEKKNEKEVLKSIDIIRKIGIMDGKVIKKINETYKELKREDLLKEFAKEIMQDDIRDDIVLEEIKEAKPTATSAKPKPKKEVSSLDKEDLIPHHQIVDLEKEVKDIKTESAKLDSVVSDVEAAISQLRKAMRLDEIVVALEKSMGALSDEQKKSLALFQKSLQQNLEGLQESVKKMDECSERNLKELRPSITKLGDSLSSLNRNQATFVEKMDGNFKEMSKAFGESTKQAINEVKHVLGEYQGATADMCEKLDKTKECNLSMLKSNEDMNNTVIKMNDSLTKYLMAQEVKDRKQGKFTLAVLVILVVITALFVVSIIVK